MKTILRSLLVTVAAALLIPICLAHAEDKARPAKLSVTVTNPTTYELHLTVSEQPRPPVPPNITPWGLSARPVAIPPDVQAPPAGPVERTIKPTESTLLELPPGCYQIVTSGNRKAPAPGAVTRTRWAIGYVSVSNSEVWVFTVVKNDGGWALDVPSRPGVHLSATPERSPPVLPQRAQRLDSSTRIHDLPERTLRLPGTNGPRLVRLPASPASP